MAFHERLPGETETRREFVVVGIDQSQTLDIVAPNKLPCSLVKGAEITAKSVGYSPDPFIPQTEIERQMRRNLPIILGEPVEMRNGGESCCHLTGPQSDEWMSQ